MGDGTHVPVLRDEVLSALAIRPDGVYVDGTFGRGGHARAILGRLTSSGRLVALDRDPDAERSARDIDDPRFAFRRCWFSEFPDALSALGIAGIDGFLLDLGISSPQIDDPARGFSFRADGPLDMRMDPTRGESAAAFLARATAREIMEVIRDYGEERFAQSIARAIVATRSVAAVERTRQLAAIVAKAVGARPRGDRSQDPATRTFQALRIFVNSELAELALTLPRVVPWMRTSGRIAVVSFHSLEDRIVKRFFAAASKPFGGDPRLAKLPIRADAIPGAPLAQVGRAIRPSAREIAANPRARSATLRAAERTANPIPPNFGAVAAN